MKKVVSFLFLLFFTFSYGFSQRFIFSNYSINNGLSQSVVNCIYQDSKGFIWIGTQNGLNRFNGESFDVISYNPLDSNSISNNWIYSIAEDADGNLWVGTKGGLNKYLVKQKKFQRIKFEKNFLYDISRYTYDIICLKNKKILINIPPAISIYDFTENNFTWFQSKLEYDGAVKDVKIPIIEDNTGTIWIGSTKGLSSFTQNTKEYKYFTFVNKKGKQIDELNITALYQNRKNEIWVGTTTGLFKYNSQKELLEESQFAQKNDKNFSFENICIRSIIEDKKGNLIIGTEGKGLYVLSKIAVNTYFIENYLTSNSEISHDIVQSLIIDKSENLWIGTLQGISKTDLKDKKFKLYRNNNTPYSLNLFGNVIASLYKDTEGILWVGNWGQGLNKVDRSTGYVEHFSTELKGNHKINNDFIHVIFEDTDHNIWLGTRNGILIYDKPNNKFIPYYEYFKIPELPSFKNIRIYMIIQDKFSNYWIGTQNGLYKINLKNLAIDVYSKELDFNHQISANLVYCLLEDSDGLIWIATVSGLDVYNPVTRKIKHFRKNEKELCDDFIITLCEDSKGRIWIGTSSYVNMFNKKDSTFKYYSQEHGIPNNRIFEIINDKNNNLWFATGKGLCKFDEKKQTFQTFTIEDGLQSLEFNIRAAYACKDGEILIGGMNGFNTFNPDSIKKNQFIPNLSFTSFYKTKGISKEYINIENLSEVTLSHDVSSFTIEFAALEYTNPQKNLYAYKMDGVSDEWIYIGNRRFVPFYALQPGEYIFKVKGSNNDEVWNNNEISLKIIILPPWWKSIYAYIFYSILILFVIVFFIKIRERKLIFDKKKLEEKILERTWQINEQNQLIISKNIELSELNSTKDKFFSIIGHDLRNPFDTIISSSEILMEESTTQNEKKTKLYLSNIHQASKHAYELLENLLSWARMQTKSIQYKPESFNVNYKIIESIELLEGALLHKEIELNVFTKEEIYIYADVNMFATIFRNLLTNAIKFTYQKGEISIHIYKKENFCEITVEDNGIGISEENIKKVFRIDNKHSTLGTNNEKGTGLGLILCKEFIELNKGRIWVESIIGKGSKFIFTLPVKV